MENVRVSIKINAMSWRWKCFPSNIHWKLENPNYSSSRGSLENLSRAIKESNLTTIIIQKRCKRSQQRNDFDFCHSFYLFCASSILFDLFYGGPGFVRASKDQIDNYLTTKNTGCQNKADTNKTKHRCHNGWLSDGKYRWDGTWTAQTKKKQWKWNNSLSDVRLWCCKNCFKNSCSNLKASI